MRVIFIDDEAENVAAASRRLTQEGHECRIASFDEAPQTLPAYQPSLVVLDLMQAGSTAESTNEGTPLYERIWAEWFCPVIIYSAWPDQFSVTQENDPFVRIIQKGSSSVDALATAVTELGPHVEALASSVDSVRREFNLALRRSAPLVFRAIDDSAQRDRVLQRIARRRLAAQIDRSPELEGRPASWEQYVYPPVGGSLQLGDIIQKSGAPDGSPSQYRIILTPSCDLSVSEGRTPKVAGVLVAGCCAVKEALERVGLSDAKRSTLEKRLRDMAVRGSIESSLLLIPALPGVFAEMVGDMRALELLCMDGAGTQVIGFDRIASVDSPFREHLAWAYLQTACRPGLPDRDIDAWVSNLVSACGEREEQ